MEHAIPLAAANDSVPVWVILVTALGSGVIGAFATAWMTKRSERQEAWRGRLIAAAEDFLRRLSKANGAIQQTVHILKVGEVHTLPGQRPVSFADQWVIAVELKNQLKDAHSRLALLFGIRSEVAMAAAKAIKVIDDVEARMTDGLPEGASRDEWFDALESMLKQTAARSLVFSDVANKAIWARPSRPAGEAFEAALQRTHFLGHQTAPRGQGDPTSEATQKSS